MLLYCCQNPDFLDKLNLNAAECALKLVSFPCYVNGNAVNRKTTVLDYVSSVINHNQTENCFGSEYYIFYKHFVTFEK